uniref:Uncharacterized protein n=1 Tax=Mycena chlorophos TaxID=658473 RepID=A0ABQ0KX38_MYCCL|nr:predicted protein [Mycena chlorophos]
MRDECQCSGVVVDERAMNEILGFSDRRLAAAPRFLQRPAALLRNSCYWYLMRVQRQDGRRGLDERDETHRAASVGACYERLLALPIYSHRSGRASTALWNPSPVPHPANNHRVSLPSLAHPHDDRPFVAAARKHEPLLVWADFRCLGSEGLSFRFHQHPPHPLLPLPLHPHERYLRWYSCLRRCLRHTQSRLPMATRTKPRCPPHRRCPARPLRLPRTIPSSRPHVPVGASVDNAHATAPATSLPTSPHPLHDLIPPHFLCALQNASSSPSSALQSRADAYRLLPRKTTPHRGLSQPTQHSHNAPGAVDMWDDCGARTPDDVLTLPPMRLAFGLGPLGAKKRTRASRSERGVSAHTHAHGAGCEEDWVDAPIRSTRKGLGFLHVGEDAGGGFRDLAREEDLCNRVGDAGLRTPQRNAFEDICIFIHSYNWSSSPRFAFSRPSHPATASDHPDAISSLYGRKLLRPCSPHHPFMTFFPRSSSGHYSDFASLHIGANRSLRGRSLISRGTETHRLADNVSTSNSARLDRVFCAPGTAQSPASVTLLDWKTCERTRGAILALLGLSFAAAGRTQLKRALDNMHVVLYSQTKSTFAFSLPTNASRPPFHACAIWSLSHRKRTPPALNTGTIELTTLVLRSSFGVAVSSSPSLRSPTLGHVPHWLESDSTSRPFRAYRTVRMPYTTSRIRVYGGGSDAKVPIDGSGKERMRFRLRSDVVDIGSGERSDPLSWRNSPDKQQRTTIPRFLRDGHGADRCFRHLLQRDELQTRPQVASGAFDALYALRRGHAYTWCPSNLSTLMPTGRDIGRHKRRRLANGPAPWISLRIRIFASGYQFTIFVAIPQQTTASLRSPLSPARNSRPGLRLSPLRGVVTVLSQRLAGLRRRPSHVATLARKRLYIPASQGSSDSAQPSPHFLNPHIRERIGRQGTGRPPRCMGCRERAQTRRAVAISSARNAALFERVFNVSEMAQSVASVIIRKKNTCGRTHSWSLASSMRFCIWVVVSQQRALDLI